jgi:DNA end-binding protein Ku
MPIRSGILSFGLVSIPVKVFPAVKDQTIRFHWLHKKCGNRIRYQWYCPVDEEVVDPDDLVHGYPKSKDKYVALTDEELESVEAEANRNIELKEFVPMDSVDPVYFESSYYLGAEKGSEKPYRLLANALKKTNRIAVAQLVSRGKEELVLIRPFEGGLIMHTSYYADEVRDFEQVPKGDSARVGRQEVNVAEGLIDRLSGNDFDPERYEDEYRVRVLGMLEQKRRGGEITVSEEPQEKRRATQVVDLMQALKESIAATDRSTATRRPRAAERKRRKRAS